MDECANPCGWGWQEEGVRTGCAQTSLRKDCSPPRRLATKSLFLLLNIFLGGKGIDLVATVGRMHVSPHVNLIIVLRENGKWESDVYTFLARENTATSTPAHQKNHRHHGYRGHDDHDHCN